MSTVQGASVDELEGCEAPQGMAMSATQGFGRGL